jgi:AcrR family transcriptional regulator
MTIRPPQQARSRATWTKVLDAGVDILEHQGHEALTIQNVCERAGVTPPTVYARAPDKQSLLRAIHDHAVDRFEADLVLAPGTSSRDAVAAIAHLFLDNAPLMRAIIRQASSEPEIYERGSAEVTILGRTFRAAVGGDERRADACYRIVVGASAHRVVDGPTFTSDVPQTDTQFVEALCEMAERYLAAS